MSSANIVQLFWARYIKRIYYTVLCKFAKLIANYFLAGFAKRAGLYSSRASPFTENSRSARSFNVPPHLSPRLIKAAFNTSKPRSSSCAAE